MECEMTPTEITGCCRGKLAGEVDSAQQGSTLEAKG